MFQTHSEPRIASAHKLMRYWMYQETARLRMLLTTAAFLALLYGIPLSSLHNRPPVTAIAIGLTALFFVFVLLPHLLCTRFAVKHSAIGRQLREFGDFDTVYDEILASIQSPLYTNGTEAISEKYIFLMPEPANMPHSPAFLNKERLLVLPVEWLARVSIKPNEPYPDEMNTVLFRTQRPPANAAVSNCLYTMTIHMDAATTAELVQTITAHMHPADSTEEAFDFHAQSASSRSNAAANSYPYKSTRSPAARSAARFCSAPLRELRAGKMRVFRLVVFFIVFANVGTLLFVYFMEGKHTLSTLLYDFSTFIRRELLSDPQQLLFLLALLAFYLIPTISIYVMIQRWYHGFLGQYKKLPQQEQQELLAKLCDNFATGQPAVIYTEHCFCFRDVRRLSFQILLPYSSVLWMYRSHSFFPINGPTPGLNAEVDFYRLIVRTADRKKYCIPSGDEPKLSRHVPDAVVGYGDIQRETYLDKVRSRKG